MTMNDRKLNGFLYVAYIVFFSIFVLFAGLVGIHVHARHLKWAIALVVCVACIAGLIRYKEAIAKLLDVKYSIYIIVLLGVILRIFFYIWDNPQQYSDFYQATRFWDHLQEIGGTYGMYTTKTAEMDGFQIYYSLYPAWGRYMLLTHLIYHILGRNTLWMVCLNFIFDVAIMICTQKIASLLSTRRVSIMCVAVIAFWPQFVIWTSVTSPDHIIIFFLCLMCYYYMNYLQCRDDIKSGSFNMIIAVICAVIASIFKPIIMFIFVVLLCSEVLNLICGQFKGIKRSLLYMAEVVVAFVMLSIPVNTILDKTLSSYIKTDVNQATGYYILWGYSVDENGIYDTTQAGEAIQRCETSETLAEGLEGLKVDIEKTLKKNFHLIPSIWWQKFRLLFYSETWPVWWSVNNADGHVNENVENALGYWTGVWTIANALMMFLMPFAFREGKSMVNFLSLMWLGFMIYLVVGAGVQGRYRMIVFVPQVILCVIGANQMSKLAIHKNKQSI